MDDDLKKFLKFVVYIAFPCCLLLLGLFLWGNWYYCGVQSQVYKRQGIEISQWELFVGAKPKETVIQIRDGDRK